MNIREQIKLVNIALSGTLDLYRIWAKKHQLNYNALVILYTLNDYKICTQKQICDWWALPKQTVHGILLDFEKKGYISIIANKENKRERLISFTEEGEIFALSILKKLHQMEENAMHNLGEEKRQQLIDCNTMYYELLKEEMQNE
ncbi:MAG: MarR family winged helix-turn-helix transcriptional regulator [Beduini sp.]|uniref:MarR family winged helix-turn-helix transcriptional regulator n=1 Tax=Beduini sp. TaxID=1922300 RepID=UPI0039A1C729